MKIRGARATREPTRCHTESVSANVVSPTCGTRGQNTQRPNSTSAGGSTTSAKVAATTIPTAQARPRPRVVGMSDSSRVSRPRTTVVALARMASEVRRSASDMASYRSSCRRSSSR